MACRSLPQHFCGRQLVNIHAVCLLLLFSSADERPFEWFPFLSPRITLSPSRNSSVLSISHSHIQRTTIPYHTEPISISIFRRTGANAGSCLCTGRNAVYTNKKNIIIYILHRISNSIIPKRDKIGKLIVKKLIP